MRNLVLAAFAVTAVTGISAPSSAEGVANRYQMEKTENGYVRLDTMTGEMSVCVENGGRLSCRAAKDERQALNDSIDMLETRITALEQNAHAGPAPEPKILPDDEEIEKTLGVMEKFMRGFFDIAKELREDTSPAPEMAPKTGVQPDHT